MEEIKIPKPFNVYKARILNGNFVISFGYASENNGKLTDDDLEECNVISIRPEDLLATVKILTTLGIKYQKVLNKDIGFKDDMLK